MHEKLRNTIGINFEEHHRQINRVSIILSNFLQRMLYNCMFACELKLIYRQMSTKTKELLMWKSTVLGVRSCTNFKAVTSVSIQQMVFAVAEKKFYETYTGIFKG